MALPRGLLAAFSGRPTKLPQSTVIPSNITVTNSNSIVGGTNISASLSGSTTTIALSPSPQLATSGVYGWNSDVGLVRIAPGQVAVGNGTSGDISGLLLNPRPGFLNANPAFMLNTMQMMANVRKGVSNGTIAYVGDSLVVGAYGDGTLAGLWSAAPPARLASILNVEYGIPASAASELNNHVLDASGTLTNFNHFDPRVTVGAGWASDATSTDQNPGGYWWFNSTTTNSWAFTPGVAFDSVSFMSVQFPGGGSLTVDIDGAATTTINENGAASLIFTTIAKGSAGTTVNIKRVSGTVAIAGPICYSSSTPQLNIINLGADGWAANNYANFMTTATDIRNFGQKLTIISLGFNDLNTGRTPAQLTTDLTAVVGQAKIAGDVILLVPNPVSAGIMSLPNQAILRQTIINVGLATNCWIVDFNQLFGFGNYTAMNTAGLIVDTVHPAGTGYDAMANLLASVLVSLG